MKLEIRTLACLLFKIHDYDKLEGQDVYTCTYCNKKALPYTEVDSDYHAYRSHKRHS